METRTGSAERVQAIAAPVRELRDSLMLLALAASTLSAYVGIAFAAVRVFGTR